MGGVWDLNYVNRLVDLLPLVISCFIVPIKAPYQSWKLSGKGDSFLQLVWGAWHPFLPPGPTPDCAVCLHSLILLALIEKNSLNHDIDVLYASYMGIAENGPVLKFLSLFNIHV